MRGCGVQDGPSITETRRCECGTEVAHTVAWFKPRNNPNGPREQVATADPHRAPCGGLCRQAEAPSSAPQRLDEKLHPLKGCPACAALGGA